MKLPIEPLLPRIVDGLRHHAAVVLQAPTGAGKTTCVPPALLDAGLAGAGRILMLEPRRLAARAAAYRMAAERGGRPGEEVGYHVRFDRCAGPRTRLLVVTPGILLRLLHDDPYLESTGLVIFDEFHERGLECDLALGMVRLIQQTVRPELRIAVMSATLAAGPVAAYLGDCPVVVGEGRSHPVQVLYLPRPAEQPLAQAVAAAVGQLLDQTTGDVLVFLPGLNEIRQAGRQLQALAAARNLAILPLHGDLPAEQQDAALLALDRRKVVLATNVAETSITIEGITGVVDTGLARLLIHDPAVGLDRLKLTAISRAAADQRAGRAGRTQPGVCLRLWHEWDNRARPDQTAPEIRRVDLTGAVLHLLCLGEKNIRRFPWLEAPSEDTVRRALNLLRRLGAADDSGVTELGRAMARLPAQPRIGRLVIAGRAGGQLEKAALAAALLAERDPFVRSVDSRSSPPGPGTPSDLLERIEALEEFERRGSRHTPLGELSQAAARFVLRARDQLVRAVRQEASVRPGTAEPVRHPEETVGRALLAAFPDRLARRREPGSRRGVMVGGRGVRLLPSSAVTEGELFLCLDMDAGQTEALVRLASSVRREWLPVDWVQESIAVEFDEGAERVQARRRVRFEDLTLEDGPAASPANEEAARVLAGAAAARLDRVLPAADSPAGAYRLRVRCLRQWLPELALPALDETELREVLSWLCSGRRSFAELRAADWLGAFEGMLTSAQRQAVDREAPERLTVPSGSRLQLCYEEGRPPVLAVRIQEIFGWQDTPRIAGGRVRVLLHLLAPNHRPQQVTDDLASFWANTYPVVRKELRARYPRHAWPEDPWQAAAENRPRRK